LPQGEDEHFSMSLPLVSQCSSPEEHAGVCTSVSEIIQVDKQVPVSPEGWQQS